MGGLDSKKWMSGSPAGPGHKKIPNIKTKIRTWSDDDLSTLLQEGMSPSGADVSGEMAEVVNNSTKYFTDEDRAAVIEYLRSLGDEKAGDTDGGNNKN